MVHVQFPLWYLWSAYRRPKAFSRNCFLLTSRLPGRALWHRSTGSCKARGPLGSLKRYSQELRFGDGELARRFRSSLRSAPYICPPCRNWCRARRSSTESLTQRLPSSVAQRLQVRHPAGARLDYRSRQVLVRSYGSDTCRPVLAPADDKIRGAGGDGAPNCSLKRRQRRLRGGRRFRRSDSQRAVEA